MWALKNIKKCSIFCFFNVFSLNFCSCYHIISIFIHVHHYYPYLVTCVILVSSRVFTHYLFRKHWQQHCMWWLWFVLLTLTTFRPSNHINIACDCIYLVCSVPWRSKHQAHAAWPQGRLELSWGDNMTTWQEPRWPQDGPRPPKKHSKMALTKRPVLLTPFFNIFDGPEGPQDGPIHECEFAVSPICALRPNDA